jgi:penicillin-binding protein 2
MRNSRNSLPAVPVKVASMLTVLVFAVLVVAVIRLQFIRGDHYRRLSKGNYIVQVPLVAPRGNITDRNGVTVAGSRQSFSVCAVPRSILRNQREINVLSHILSVDPDFIRERLRKSSRSYRPTAVMRDVDFATVSRVEESFADLPDVIVVSEPVRCYPHGEDFSHILGYVGEVTQEDIDTGKGRYAPGDFVGKAGVERTYEPYLAGEHGEKFVKITVSGGSSPIDLEDLPARLPRPGMTVALHTDCSLQKLGQDLLGEWRGSIIAIDVSTGGVIALASSPTFDPNLFATGISSDHWTEIINSDGKPLLNRAVQSSYPPGSIYKIVTATVALEEGTIDENTRFRACRGSYRFGNRDFSCWKKEGHGSTNLIRAVSVSCDVYFYQLGERLGLDRFASRPRAWHLVKRTGIDLPGEVGGLIPGPAYYDSVYGKGKWTRGVMLNLAIGQGEILLTPMEMLCFVCAVANMGEYSVPRCVMRISSETRAFTPAEAAVNLPISDHNLEILRRSMLEVVEGPAGTGRAARLPDIEVAGKTGTAQNPHGEDHAWFVCFAPYRDPEIAVCVMLENAGHGGAVAAPLARQMLSHYFGIDEGQEVASVR